MTVRGDDPESTAGSLLREIARSPDVALDASFVGSMLGPYELLAPIGSGGMGQVFRARDARLGRDVAIKILPREYADDPDRRLRFEHEARATGALDHPNLVTIHDTGTDGHTPYIVFELLAGESLRQRLARGPVGVRQAVDFATQLARGLAVAHARGIIHRDLKPENLFVVTGDRIKILDFGLAKITRREDRASGAASTAPGMVFGTVGYMAPEQVRGDSVDHRADLFALGTIVYEMLTGRRAFDGTSAVPIMNAILTDEPAPLDAPPELARIVRRLLAKNREERYQSAHDLAFQLEGLVVDGSAPRPAFAATASPAAPAAPRRWIVPAALTVAAAAVAFGTVMALRSPKAADSTTPADPTKPADPAKPPVDRTAPSAAGSAIATSSSTPGEDRQWIQSDDYFASAHPWQSGFIYVHLAKIKERKGSDALMFMLDTGKEIWTSHFWTTHPTRPGELSLGSFALCFNSNVHDHVYQAPADKNAARTGTWFLGRVTDTSDLARGLIRVDQYNCALDGVRTVE